MTERGEGREREEGRGPGRGDIRFVSLANHTRRCGLMGARYSSGFVPEELRSVQDDSLADVSQSYTRFRKRCAVQFQNNGLFLTRAAPATAVYSYVCVCFGFFCSAYLCLRAGDDFVASFELDPGVGYRRFAFFDPRQRYKVPAMEVWGALALCCAGRHGLAASRRDGSASCIERKGSAS